MAGNEERIEGDEEMKTFEVYIRINTHKIRLTIHAKDKDEAKQKALNKVIFDSITECEESGVLL